MKMTDMRLSKADKKETSPCIASDSPSYPYGLCLRLDSAALEKLGIKALPKVGAKVSVQGLGVITAVSSHESKNQDNRNVEIQLQELGLSNQEPLTAKERLAMQRETFSQRFEAEKKGRPG